MRPLHYSAHSWDSVNHLQVIHICICLVQQLCAGLVCLSTSLLGSARSTVTIPELPDSNNGAGAASCISTQQIIRFSCYIGYVAGPEER